MKLTDVTASLARLQGNECPRCHRDLGDPFDRSRAVLSPWSGHPDDHRRAVFHKRCAPKRIIPAERRLPVQPLDGGWR